MMVETGQGTNPPSGPRNKFAKDRGCYHFTTSRPQRLERNQAMGSRDARNQSKEMLPARRVFIAHRSEADVARIQPLRMYAEIILQGSEYGVRLIDTEGAADRQVR